MRGGARDTVPFSRRDAIGEGALIPPSGTFSHPFGTGEGKFNENPGFSE
jgi:hypothetical protein